MHNSDNIINYSAAISSLVGVFKSLSYHADLKSASPLNQVVQKLPPNIKESWSLFTVKKHWVKPTLLNFNDWLKEKAEAHDLMKQSATKATPEDNQNSLKSVCIKFTTKGNEEANAIFFHKHLLSLYCMQKVTTGYGSVEFSRKRLQPRELSSWGIINFVFRAYMISTNSASALNRESAEQRGAIVHITHYCMEQIGFSQQKSQQIPIPFSLLATQVKAKQLLVNSRLI